MNSASDNNLTPWPRRTIDRTSFIRMLLDKHKISIRPTHKQWFNGIRFSLHIFNTEKEIGFAADIIHKELGK
jgi:cysteine desulfurase/selenocysteine lyase